MDQERAHYSVATLQSSPFEVVLDMSAFKPNQAGLVMAWLEIWLKLHCRSGWRLVFHEALTSRDHNSARVEFEDGREAMYFKLSPEFMLYQGQHLPGNLKVISYLQSYQSVSANSCA